MALYSPLSEIMCEFFLLVFLALFSGLFPCTEPSTVSEEDKGKKGPGPSGMRSPIKLGTTAAKCCTVAESKPSVKKAQCMKEI